MVLIARLAIGHFQRWPTCHFGQFRMVAERVVTGLVAKQPTLQPFVFLQWRFVLHNPQAATSQPRAGYVTTSIGANIHFLSFRQHGLILASMTTTTAMKDQP